MIKIFYKKNYLEIQGHSNSAQHGNDVVCAAISALVCGSVEYWRKNKNFVIYENKSIPKITISFINSDLNGGLKDFWEFNFLIDLLKITQKHNSSFVQIYKTE